MTYAAFLTALKRRKAQWFINNGMIRCQRGLRRCCPITALGVERDPTFYARDAKRLGLRAATADAIAVAADGDPLALMTTREQRMRRDLFRVLRLSETGRRDAAGG